MRLGPVVAFDTETTIVDLNREVPELVVLTAYDGRQCVVVEPSDVPAFVLAHKDCVWVGHNVSFDWWVVQRVLLEAGYWVAEEWLSCIDRMHDTMLLDLLYRLATEIGSTGIYNRDLGELAHTYCGEKISKDDPYRKRFGEIIGRLREPFAKPFLEYATKDVVSTFNIFQSLKGRLEKEGLWNEEQLSVGTVHLPFECGGVPGRHSGGGVEHPGPAAAVWGPLTERIQVRAAIVLSAVTRNGMRVDRSMLNDTRARLSQELQESVRWLEQDTPSLFSYYKVGPRKGQLKIHASTGAPLMDYGALRARLLRLADDHDIDPRTLPKTEKTGLVQIGLNLWRDRMGEEPFIQQWSRLMDTAKTLQFIAQLEQQQDNEVHTRYNVLVRTGRTSASSPNIQQMPREPWFRQLFVARPGHKLVVADYSGIEMVTLAAVLEDRFGKSVLADVLREGRDAHSYTAALVMGWDYDTFVAQLKEEKGEGSDVKRPRVCTASRQAAKAINFGVPGGLGAQKLAAYAKANYDVVLTPDEAKQLRDRLINDVYPEIGRYLDDDTADHLAASLHADLEEVRKWLDVTPARKWGAERIVSGQGTRTGQEYHPRTKALIWEALRDLNKNPALVSALEAEVPSPRLALKLFGRRVWTLTGRLRVGCSYTEAHNTPFQGLAADGAKNALWRLWLAGYRIVAFIHDEVVVEVPESGAEEAAQDVARIMSESMAEVLYCDLPVKVEYSVSDRWSK